MDYDIRRAALGDLPGMLEIFADAQRALASRNVDQWQDGYPQREILEADISRGDTWVLRSRGNVIGTAAFCFGRDPTYAKLHSGAWHTGEPYAALHRIAMAEGENGKGAAGALYAYLENIARAEGLAAVRVDTHRDNLVMQKFLQKHGFAKCGILYLPDTGAERFAFDKVL